MDIQYKYLLGANIKKLVYLLVLSFCASCNAQDITTHKFTDQASILGTKLHIFDKQNACYLNYEIKGTKSTLPLSPEPPCFLLRRNSDSPQHFEYADIGVKATLIVAGTQVTSEQSKRWGLKPGEVCGTERQGILIYSDKVVVTDNILKSGIACMNMGSDEKDFWFFAHKK